MTSGEYKSRPSSDLWIKIDLEKRYLHRKSEKMAEMNEKQRFAANRGPEGHILLVLEQSGTGKSFLIHKMNLLRRKGKNVAITATTGVAALHIGDKTVNSCSVELGLLVSYVTCNDISVIYVMAQMCRQTEEVVPTVGLLTP